MIQNISQNTTDALNKFLNKGHPSGRSYSNFEYTKDYSGEVFITDASHIYNSCIIYDSDNSSASTYGFFVLCKELWLIASGTIFLEPYCFYTNSLFGTSYSLDDIYIPYASKIETYYPNYRETSDHSNDNLDYNNYCFKSPTNIHVNQTLYSYMNSHSEIWGYIMNNVSADL